MEGDHQTAEGKKCEQCEQWKPLEAFHCRKNETDGRMRICADCYTANNRERSRQQQEHMQQWKEMHERQEEDRRQRREEEQHRREVLLPQIEEDRRRQQDAWLALQPDRQCSICQQKLPATARCSLSS
jgi:hypothetical protein